VKSLFNSDVFKDTVSRIEALQPSASRQWGKMTPSQMLEHSARALDMAIGRGPQKQVWIGKLIGWAVLKNFVGEKPFSKNSPTAPEFIVHDEPEFAGAKRRLIELMREFQTKGEAACNGNVHSFFGRMSGAEWGVMQYKHLDHHLRQFGA
jgi:hypothetical protein